MDGRDAFLNLAREKHWEFSSLRRAKYSTMSMLYELHNQGDRFVYCCNHCQTDVEFRWHCKECEVSVTVIASLRAVKNLQIAIMHTCTDSRTCTLCLYYVLYVFFFLSTGL